MKQPLRVTAFSPRGLNTSTKKMLACRGATGASLACRRRRQLGGVRATRSARPSRSLGAGPSRLSSGHYRVVFP